jgi:hypothetical protein
MTGMRRTTFALLMLAAAGCATKPVLKEGDRAMQIRFTRSGGFAGAATRVSGTVEWTDSGVHVTSDGTEYHRDLAASEAQLLEAAADPSALTRAGGASSPASPARDAFQYDITVVTRDAKAHPFTFTSSTAPDAASLLAWVEQEAQKIWTFRVNARK